MVLLLALLAVLPQEPPGREKTASFTFVRPRGWGRNDLPNGAIGLAPPGADAQQCSVFLLPGQVGDINELVFHSQVWQGATQGGRVEGTPEKAYRGSWQYTRAKVLTPQGQVQWTMLYTTKSDRHYEGVLFVASTEELLKTHRPAVERMITNVVFPDARPLPAGPNDFKPAPVPAGERDVAVVGAWTVARLEMVFSADPKAGPQQQKHTVKVVALFANGVAAKVDARSTGLMDSTFPAEGLATMDVSAPGPNDRRFGRWKESDGRIAIQWNQGAADAVQRAGDDLKEANGTTWSRIRPIDGLRLDAHYVHEIAIGLPYSIALRKDGTFDSDQVNEVIGGKLVNKKMPEMGSGLYEFRKWSLILRFDTGFVQSIHVMFDADEPADAKTIFINGYGFVRSGAAKAAPPAAGGATVHGLVIPLPPDWNRKDVQGGGVYLLPPQDAGYALFVSPSNKLQGTHWETHKLFLKSAIPWAEIKPDSAVTVHNPFGPGPFIQSTVNGQLASGQYREIQLLTAAHDGIIEAITVVNKPNTYVLWPILEKVTFKDPPKNTERPKVVEAYRKLVKKMYTTPNGGTPATGGIQYERLWLRSDGTADFSSWYGEGYAVSRDVFKLDGGLLTGHAGSWKEIDGKVHVRRTADSPAEIYERSDGNLGAYEGMPRVDGLKLSGRYSKKSQPGAGVVQFHHWIEFTEDGRFTTDGMLTFVGSMDATWPKFLDKLTGTYEIRDWTIFFKLDDGRVWTTDFSTIHKDPKDLSGILFRTVVVLKD